MNLKSKTVLVTGGAVRIGRAICMELARRGCNVAVHYNKSAKEAGELAQMIRKMEVKAFEVQGDLSTLKGCVNIVREAFKKAGKIDFLVNNAAVFHKDALMSATEDAFIREMNVNYLAPVWLTREFVTQVSGFRSQVSGISGKVVNLLDRRIEGIDPECMSYQLSKKMLAEFTRRAAIELAPRFTVNGVAPGAVLAPEIQRSEARRQKSGKRKPFDLAGNVPLRNQATPEDVAEAVAFLLGTDSITGQIIYVDGGQHLNAMGHGEMVNGR